MLALGFLALRLALGRRLARGRFRTQALLTLRLALGRRLGCRLGCRAGHRTEPVGIGAVEGR